MYQQERMDEIMKILKKNHYVTVDYLVKEIKYSPASIRRDLTLLEKQGLITRSYGGVTYKDANISPFRFRQHSMKTVKNAIAKKAASLVKNGDVVFIDGLHYASKASFNTSSTVLQGMNSIISLALRLRRTVKALFMRTRVFIHGYMSRLSPMAISHVVGKPAS